jgi:NADH:ubiquinone oxidoreductase subunit H
MLFKVNVIPFNIIDAITYLNLNENSWIHPEDIVMVICLGLDFFIKLCLPVILVKQIYSDLGMIISKFILLLVLLVFVRGGIPRYRYDYLTKLGWIKFLGLVLCWFLQVLLLIYLF